MEIRLCCRLSGRRAARAQGGPDFTNTALPGQARMNMAAKRRRDGMAALRKGGCAWPGLIPSASAELNNIESFFEKPQQDAVGIHIKQQRVILEQV